MASTLADFMNEQFENEEEDEEFMPTDEEEEDEDEDGEGNEDEESEGGGEGDGEVEIEETPEEELAMIDEVKRRALHRLFTEIGKPVPNPRYTIGFLRALQGTSTKIFLDSSIEGKKGVKVLIGGIDPQTENEKKMQNDELRRKREIARDLGKNPADVVGEEQQVLATFMERRRDLLRFNLPDVVRQLPPYTEEEEARLFKAIEKDDVDAYEAEVIEGKEFMGTVVDRISVLVDLLLRVFINTFGDRYKLRARFSVVFQDEDGNEQTDVFTQDEIDEFSEEFSDEVQAEWYAVSTEDSSKEYELNSFEFFVGDEPGREPVPRDDADDVDSASKKASGGRKSRTKEPNRNDEPFERLIQLLKQNPQDPYALTSEQRFAMRYNGNESRGRVPVSLIVSPSDKSPSIVHLDAVFDGEGAGDIPPVRIALWNKQWITFLVPSVFSVNAPYNAQQINSILLLVERLLTKIDRAYLLEAETAPKRITKATKRFEVKWVVNNTYDLFKYKFSTSGLQDLLPWRMLDIELVDEAAALLKKKKGARFNKFEEETVYLRPLESAQTPIVFAIEQERRAKGSLTGKRNVTLLADFAGTDDFTHHVLMEIDNKDRRFKLTPPTRFSRKNESEALKDTVAVLMHLIKGLGGKPLDLTYKEKTATAEGDVVLDASAPIVLSWRYKGKKTKYHWFGIDNHNDTVKVLPEGKKRSAKSVLKKEKERREMQEASRIASQLSERNDGALRVHPHYLLTCNQCAVRTPTKLGSNRDGGVTRAFCSDACFEQFYCDH